MGSVSDYHLAAIWKYLSVIVNTLSINIYKAFVFFKLKSLTDTNDHTDNLNDIFIFEQLSNTRMKDGYKSKMGK